MSKMRSEMKQLGRQIIDSVRPGEAAREAAADPEGHQLGPALDAEVAEEGLGVLVDGEATEAQPPGGLLVASSPQQAAQDLLRPGARSATEGSSPDLRNEVETVGRNSTHPQTRRGPKGQLCRPSPASGCIR